MNNIESLKQNSCILSWSGTNCSSNSPKTITSYGDCKQILLFSGVGIAMFDGTSDYLTVPDNDAWSMFGTSDNFTIEGLFYYTSIAANIPIVSQYVESPGFNTFSATGLLKTIVTFSTFDNCSINLLISSIQNHRSHIQ